MTRLPAVIIMKQERRRSLFVLGTNRLFLKNSADMEESIQMKIREKARDAAKQQKEPLDQDYPLYITHE